MLVFDAIIGNEDRHLNNWDMLISRDGIKVAPILDNGASLLAYVPDRKLSTNFKIGRDVSKPFKDTHTKQMALIKKTYPRYKFAVNSNNSEYILNNIIREIEPILKLIGNEKRAICIKKYLVNRYLHYTKIFM